VQACQLGNKDAFAMMGYRLSIVHACCECWCDIRSGLVSRNGSVIAIQLAYQLQSEEAVVQVSLTHAMAHRMTMAISTPSRSCVCTKLALPFHGRVVNVTLRKEDMRQLRCSGQCPRDKLCGHAMGIC
jgi:hypothetical protein